MGDIRIVFPSRPRTHVRWRIQIVLCFVTLVVRWNPKTVYVYTDKANSSWKRVWWGGGSYLDLHGSLRFHRDSFGLTWTRLDTLGLTWTRLDSLAVTWTHLDVLGLTWTHLDSLGLSWFHLDSLGLTWTHLDSLGSTRIHLDSLGLTRSHQGIRIPGQRGKGKAGNPEFDLIHTRLPDCANARKHARHDTKQFPSWTHPPASEQ